MQKLDKPFAADGLNAHSTTTRHDDVMARIHRPLEQLQEFIAHYPGLNPVDRVYINYFMSSLLMQEHTRACELLSIDLREAAEIADEYFQGEIIFNVGCVDGRLMRVLMFGITPNMKGGVLKTPAGDLLEVIFRGGKPVIHSTPESRFDKQLAVSLSLGNTVQVLDSHLHCIARNKMTVEQTGSEFEDFGLRRDVQRKRSIASAMYDFQRNDFPHAQLSVVHCSFNPENGTSFWGLNLDRNLQHGRSIKEGYTKDVLHELVASGSVLSTEALIAEEPYVSSFGKIRELYVSQGHAHDWVGNFEKTANRYWRSIRELAPQLFPDILRRVRSVYRDDVSEPDMHRIAKLVLLNAFSAFCNNIGGTYPFHSHNESYVEVSRGGFTPNRITPMGVYINDVEAPGSVRLTGSIIRSNRKDHRIHSPYHSSPADFAAGALPVVVKEVISQNGTPDFWKTIQGIRWDFLRTLDWRKVDDATFNRMMARENPTIPIIAAVAVNDLRKACAEIYKACTARLKDNQEGTTVVIAALAGKARETHVILPFAPEE